MRKTLSPSDLDDQSAGGNEMTDRRQAASKNADLQVHIGDKLKALYAEVVNQPVPDHLLDLVHNKSRRQIHLRHHPQVFGL